MTVLLYTGKYKYKNKKRKIKKPEGRRQAISKLYGLKLTDPAKLIPREEERDFVRFSPIRKSLHFRPSGFIKVHYILFLKIVNAVFILLPLTKS